MSWDALRFCRDHGVMFSLSGKNVRPGWVHFCCPICDDHSNHGGFNPENGTYACWRCNGSHPNIIISKLLHISSSEAQKVYEEYEGATSMRKALNREKGPKPTKIDLPGGSLRTPHVKYLQKRGFDPDEIMDRFGVLGTGPTETWEGCDFRLRIIIPIYDLQGRLVNFQGRDITNRQELRYKGPPVDKVPLHHKHTLYGAHTARNTSRIVAVEGVMDQWRMGDGFVCTFGTSLTSQQIYLLSQWDEVIFLFDPEPEAQKRAREYGTQLAALGRSVEIISADFGAGRDPGDLSPTEAQEVRRELGI